MKTAKRKSHAIFCQQRLQKVLWVRKYVDAFKEIRRANTRNGKREEQSAFKPVLQSPCYPTCLPSPPIVDVPIYVIARVYDTKTSEMLQVDVDEELVNTLSPPSLVNAIMTTCTLIRLTANKDSS